MWSTATFGSALIVHILFNYWGETVGLLFIAEATTGRSTAWIITNYNSFAHLSFGSPSLSEREEAFS